MLQSLLPNIVSSFIFTNDLGFLIHDNFMAV